MIRYDKLWETMKQKGITQYNLINYTSIADSFHFVYLKNIKNQ